MEKEVKFIFPFKIDNKEYSTTLSIQIARKESTISFSLPFNLYLSINNATIQKHSKISKNFLYVFTFEELIHAKEFMDEPIIFVLNESIYKSREVLEKETNEFFDNFKEKKKSSKKVLIEHEDGFFEYVTEEI